MQQLDGETVRLLAGSQTISTVQAVVKELVENSLDAQATNLEVKLENYGLDVVEVVDNGSGISRADSLYLARPHFTSKITSFGDLCDLRSYGFRGEALSSIAAIAHLRVSTLCSGDEDSAGRQYEFDQLGNSISFKHVAMSQGTTVSVTNLFKSVPVRRQVLKSARNCKEGLRKIEDLMLAFGIAHPQVRFILKHNKCLLWQKIATTDYDANLSQVLSASVTNNLSSISFKSSEPYLVVRGFVPSPVVTDAAVVSRSAPDRVFVFVNNRPVLIKQISQILRQSFVEVFPSQSGRHPVAVVHLRVAPSSLDVNLDPSKTSVLLDDLEYVCSTLSSLLSQLYYKPPEPLTEETSSLTHTEDIKELQHGEREIEREQLHHAAESKGSRDQKEASFEGASEFYVNEHKESTPSTAVVDFHNSPLLAVSPPSSSSTSSSESGNEVAGDLSVPLTAGHHSPVSNGGSPQCAVERVAPMQDDMEAVDGSGKTGCEMSGRVSNGKSDVTRGPVNLLQWSRGTILQDEDNRAVEPVRLLQPQSESDQQPSPPCLSTTKSQTTTSSLKHNFPISSPLPRMLKRKHDHTSSSSSVPKKQKPGPGSHGSTTAVDKQPKLCFETLPLTQSLPFNLFRMKERLQCPKAHHGEGERTRVIGYCDPPGVWLVLANKSISGFLTARLQEIVEVSQAQALLERIISTETNLSSHFHTIHELKSQGL